MNIHEYMKVSYAPRALFFTSPMWLGPMAAIHVTPGDEHGAYKLTHRRDLVLCCKEGKLWKIFRLKLNKRMDSVGMDSVGMEEKSWKIFRLKSKL